MVEVSDSANSKRISTICDSSDIDAQIKAVDELSGIINAVISNRVPFTTINTASMLKDIDADKLANALVTAMYEWSTYDKAYCTPIIGWIAGENGDFCKSFFEAGIIPPLVNFLHEKDGHYYSAYALWCITYKCPESVQCIRDTQGAMEGLQLAMESGDRHAASVWEKIKDLRVSGCVTKTNRSCE